MERSPGGSELLAQLEGQCFVRQEEGVLFLDLLNPDEVWEPHSPPPSVLKEQTLSEGLYYLQSLGARGHTILQLVLGLHNSAQHFEDIVKAHGSALKDAYLVGIEAHPRLDIYRGKLPDLRAEIEQAEGRGAFQRAQIDWLSNRRKIILPCEIARSSPLNQAMYRLWDTFLETFNNCQREDPQVNQVLTIIEGAIHSTRQWTILAQLGYWLKLAESQKLFSADEDTTIPLILGAWHAPSQQRLINYCHLPVQVLATPFELAPEMDTYGAVFMDIVANHAATWQQLNTRQPRGL